MARSADVLVGGAGNAGFCAAHAAREQEASVLMLEKTLADEAGGNSFYTAGAFRVIHDGAWSLREYLDESTRARLDTTVLHPYASQTFVSDMRRLTGDRCDDAMTDRLVAGSAGVVEWLSEHGIRWRLMYERQSYVRDGQDVFFGGLALGTVGGGKGLSHRRTLTRLVSGSYNRQSNDRMGT